MTKAARGYPPVILQEVDSTNLEAARRHAAGEMGPLWIAAFSQTAGRGRSGRAWQSPAGNLSATCIIPFAGSVATAPGLALVAALAVADTVAVCAPGRDVRLKWPNDVLLDGCKISGILIESFGQNPDGTLAVAIGIGINLATSPDPAETRWPATSIKAQTGRAPEFHAALDALADNLERWLRHHDQNGAGPIRDAWKLRAAHLGRKLSVQTPSGRVDGIFADLDECGGLVLETPDGARSLMAGDVTLLEADLAARD